MARLQGLTAGANLTGRKRQKFEVVPACSIASSADVEDDDEGPEITETDTATEPGRITKD